MVVSESFSPEIEFLLHNFYHPDFHHVKHHDVQCWEPHWLPNGVSIRLSLRLALGRVDLIKHLYLWLPSPLQSDSPPSSCSRAQANTELKRILPWTQHHDRVTNPHRSALWLNVLVDWWTMLSRRSKKSCPPRPGRDISRRDTRTRPPS